MIEEVGKWKIFLKHLEEFRRAAKDLDKAMGDLSTNDLMEVCDEFPFSRSFDEVVYSIDAYKDKMEQKLNK